MLGKRKKLGGKREEEKIRLKSEFDKRRKELNSAIVRDIEIYTMAQRRIEAKEAMALWGGVKRDVAVYLQNFINYNKDVLSFLGIECRLSTSEMAIILTASQMVGCAPLISPVTGKQCGNCRVLSEYKEDFDGIIPLINGDIDLKYRKDLRLNHSPFAHPPIYLECIKFIEDFNQLDETHWKKFTNFYKEQRLPSSSTDWGKYALRSYDPTQRLKYPNKINQLVIEHPEWLELMFVLSIAIAEVQSKATPNSVRQNYSANIVHLKHKIPYQKIRPKKELKIHKNDPVPIQNIKQIGNNILNNMSTFACAWTFNITKLYERYVQYIFEEVSKKLNGRLFNNNKYQITGQRPSWSLHYLEPDVILQYGREDVIIDAKYKSHMMNLKSGTEILRDSFRKDLHQVLAYSSLSEMKEKKIILCYPCKVIIHKKLILNSSFNSSRAIIYLLGIPLNKNSTKEITNYIYGILMNDKIS